jgi:hypothetical protein
LPPTESKKNKDFEDEVKNGNYNSAPHNLAIKHLRCKTSRNKKNFSVEYPLMQNVNEGL